MVPGRVPVRSPAAAPAAHSARRRSLPSGFSPFSVSASSAPEVASASAWAVDRVMALVSWSMSLKPSTGRDATIESASSVPIVLIPASPSLIAGLPPGPDSRPAWAPERLMSGRCTVTPCRLASATSDCGE